MKLLKRTRIKMFIHDYYFGYSGFMTAIRIFGGPLTLLAGISLYFDENKFGIAYGGFCMLYGIYYTFKPLLWIAFRLDSFKTINLEIVTTDTTIKLIDDVSESVIQFNGFERIFKRSNYYVFDLTKSNKVYIPISLLTDEQKTIIDTNLKE
jgi:hypothetical protein